MKTYLIKIDYSNYVTDDKMFAFQMLDSIKAVSQEYIKETNGYIYIPKDIEVEMKIIDSNLIRPLTKQEEENKALASAESNASYYKGENANLKKQIEELKCQIKVLTKEETNV